MCVCVCVFFFFFSFFIIIINSAVWRVVPSSRPPSVRVATLAQTDLPFARGGPELN